MAETTTNDLTEMDLKKAKIKAYGAEYYEANREKIKKYYEANKVRVKEYQAANREKINATVAKYQAANRKEIKAYQAAYRAAKKAKAAAAITATGDNHD